MIETDHTKQIIARSLMELMKKKPLEKISVAQIADNCGLNRHTFYYHFNDKQDLVRWIFDYDTSECIEMSQPTDVAQERHTAHIHKIIDIMYANKSFYINALSDAGQNSLQEYLYDVIFAFRKKQIYILLDGRAISPEAEKFLADYYTCAIYGLIMRWVKNNMPDPEGVFYRGFMNVAFRSMELLIRYNRPEEIDLF